MKRQMILLLAAAAITAGSAARGEPSQLQSEIRCRFQGDKHDPVRKCRLRSTFLVNLDRELEVRCDGKTVYKGDLAYSSTASHSDKLDINEGAVTTLSAFNGSYAVFPFLKFDAFIPTIGDSKEFEDVAANLQLSPRTRLVGTCDSEIFVQGTVDESLAPNPETGTYEIHSPAP